MTLLTLAWKSLWNRKLTTLLTVASIAVSVALLVGVEQLRASARESFSGTISDTDLIVGPRAGTVSLLLYSVFRIGAPLNNVKYETYEHFSKHPAVRWTIPLAFGDSHRGFRVVGTDANFYEHYRFRRDRRVTFAEGGAPKEPLDVALGADVARLLGYRIGSKVVMTHGVAGSVIEHDDQPFLVTGILAPTATPIDRGLYITFAGVEAMHHEDHEEGAAHKDEHKHEDHDHKGEAGHEDHDHPTEQVSAFFLRTKSRIDTLRLQREIATFEAEPLSAVIPGVALAELWSTVRYAEDALRIVSGFVLVVSLIGLLISLYVTLNERRREMSILRALGVGPGQIAALMMLESTVLTAFGCATGVALLMSAQTAAQSAIERNFGLYLRSASLTRDAWIALALILAAGALLGLIPAWRAYRNSLADGLSIRL